MKTDPEKINCIVLVTPHYFMENLGDGDTGYRCIERFRLYCNKEKIEFQADKWVEALYLCQCELEPKSFFSLNNTNTKESTILYNLDKEEYEIARYTNYFDYVLSCYDFFDECGIINQFRTQRVRSILASSCVGDFIVGQPNEHIINSNGWKNEEICFNPKDNGFPFEIDLYKDSNIQELPLPKSLDNNIINIYLTLPSEYLEDDNRYKYFIGSNVENIFEYIPFDLQAEIYSLVRCTKWERIHYGDFIKGEKIRKVIQLLNERMGKFGYMCPRFHFHIGNDIVCKYRVPLEVLIEKDRFQWLASQITKKSLAEARLEGEREGVRGPGTRCCSRPFDNRT